MRHINLHLPFFFNRAAYRSEHSLRCPETPRSHAISLQHIQSPVDFLDTTMLSTALVALSLATKKRHRCPFRYVAHEHAVQTEFWDSSLVFRCCATVLSAPSLDALSAPTAERKIRHLVHPRAIRCCRSLPCSTAVTASRSHRFGVHLVAVDTADDVPHAAVATAVAAVAPPAAAAAVGSTPLAAAVDPPAARTFAE